MHHAIHQEQAANNTPNRNNFFNRVSPSSWPDARPSAEALEVLEELLEPSQQDMNTLLALFADRRYIEAATLAQALTVRFPMHGFGWKVLGTVFRRMGQKTDALASLQKATALSSSDAEAHNNMGNALKDLYRLDEAEASFRRALQINPDYAEAYCNLGVALHDLARFTDAKASYLHALEIKPDYVEVHNNLGNALYATGGLDDALASYQRALDLKPDYAEAHNNVGAILRVLGRLADAEFSFRRAFQLRPECFEFALRTHLLLPIIHETGETIALWRERYRRGISILETSGFSCEPDKLDPHSFYLAYHNQSDKPLMESLHHMFRKRVTELTVTAPHVLDWQAPLASHRRIRVGVLSQFLCAHTIGSLFQGFVRQLDRRRFEVVIIHGPKAKADAVRQNIDTMVERAIALPAKLEDQQAAVMAECLDVLFYPDIGMDPASYLLAYARLAPVQVVSWGHPDTSGLDSMDYFLSAMSIEPADAEEHYTERIICLNRLPCYYEPLVVPTQTPVRQALGLPETGTLYGCPQSLFKFHPDFDSVLAAIAEGDPNGYIVLIEGKDVSWVNLLKARWAIKYPVLLKRAIFLPRMPTERFMALMANFDILLDPIYFGSGNTMYEAMVYGTPIITWPGRFMRGRIVAGAYRQMGIADAPIAEQLEDYAPLALALGSDIERRNALRQASLQGARELFFDIRAVREIEVFFEAAVEAAARGEKLSQGWRPIVDEGNSLAV